MKTIKTLSKTVSVAWIELGTVCAVLGSFVGFVATVVR